MSEQNIINFVVDRVQEWEQGMSQFFGLWNEDAANYEMKYQDGERRPQGISKNVIAETARAVNTLATTITTMQTSSDPYFELRNKGGMNITEDQIYDMEIKIKSILNYTEFERYLLKGNRGMCLFGTQVWEKPLISYPIGSQTPIFEGTAFRPLSLLQCAFNSMVYDMDMSDHMTPIIKIDEYGLRNMAYQNPEIWNLDEIEKGIKESQTQGDTGFGQSAIEQRRQKAGYSQTKKNQHELILFNGRCSKEVLESPEFQEMWTSKFGRTDDPRFWDQTIGILNRRHIVRMHPTPYGTWRHLYCIGRYIEFEIEPMNYGVGSMGRTLQRDLNRVLRYCNDVAKFSLFNMFLAGKGSGLKSNYMNVFPWSAIPVDDINQIKPLIPQIEGLNYGLKLLEFARDDFRAVTHATTTLQAVITGATATESSLAQGEALRALSCTTRANAGLLRSYYNSLMTNLIDQNPYDSSLVPLQMEPKLTTDKDYKPEHAQKLLEFLNFLTSIRNTVPLDVNVMPIIEYLARSVGVPPRELSKPRPQADRMLDVLKRLSGNGTPANEVLGETQSAGQGGVNPAIPQRSIPTSPLPTI